MKKNRMMRLASGLLVAVLLTTSMIAGTFAKYTTQDSAKDSARVAKWGVELQVLGSLYGDEYSSNTGKPITTVEDPDFISVKSSDSSKVLAPGTESDGGIAIKLTGKPEVSSRVTAVIESQNIFLNAGTYGVMVGVPEGKVTTENFADDTYYKLDGTTYVVATSAAEAAYTLEDATVLSKTYYPVVYAYNDSQEDYTEDSLANIAYTLASAISESTLTKIDAADVKSADKMAKTKYEVTSAIIAPNTGFDTLPLNGKTLTWAWDIENNECKKEGDDAGELCLADTILGNLATDVNVVMLDGATYKVPTKYVDYCTETSFSIDITVTQVD